MDVLAIVVLVGLLALLPLAAVAAPSPLMLAEVYRGGVVLADYLVSEKLDGVRVYWDGDTLFTRSGYRVNAPDWFVAGFPSVPLDGELWAGRGRFSHVNSVVQRYETSDEDWRSLSMMVFDLPSDRSPYQERYQHLERLLDTANVDWLQRVEQVSIDSDEALKAQLSEITAAGGEGLMLQRRMGRYTATRSAHLLKLKPVQDAEATVVGYVPGKGKYQGMTGSLRVRMDDGREFRVGSGLTDALRQNPPPTGARITFAYNGLTRHGLPRFARFLRVRAESL